MKKIYFFILILILLISSSFLLKINIFILPINIIRKIINPITSDVFTISTFINKKANSFLNIKKILEENEKLTEENKKLIQKNNYLIEKQKELQEIEKSVSYLKNFNYKLAKVLTIDRELTNTLVINVGRVDGIEVGYPVIFEEGFIIGKIISVDDTISTVLLSIDQKSEIAATISGYENNIGIINGSYGLNFNFNFVSIKQEINNGDIIITSGIEKNIPSGFIIGKVETVEYIKSDFFKKVLVSPIVSFENFRILSVIMPNK